MPSPGRGAARALRSVAVVAAAIAVSFSFAGRAGAQTTRTAAIKASIVDGVLQVTGTNGADSLTLTPFQSLATIGIFDTTSGTLLFTFNRVDFTAIDVSALGGNDSVIATNGVGGMGPLTIDGGTGSDRLFGGDGNDVIIGGGGNDFIDGNMGSDVVSMGNGNDTFNWDPGDGSDTVEGDAGTDTLRFNGSNAAENIELAANGTRLRFTRDVAAVTMNVNAVEDVAVTTIGSADNVTIDDLTGTGVANATVDLASQPGSGSGDGAADHVTVDGTAANDSIAVTAGTDGDDVTGLATKVHVTGGEPALDTLTAAGLGGNDTMTVNPDVGRFITVVADGGADVDTVVTNGTNQPDTFAIGTLLTSAFVENAAGQAYDAIAEHLDVNTAGGDDTVLGQNGIAALTQLSIDGGSGNDTLFGGDGNDVIDGGTGNDFVDGNIGSDVVLMGSGNDTFEWDPGDGSDVVEGQQGNDTIRFNGSNAAEKISLSANGSRLKLLRDVAAITMDAGDVENVVVNTVGSADTVTVNNLTGTTVRQVTVDLAFLPGSNSGDGAADDVIVNGTNGNDNVTVSGVAGSGSATVTGLVPSVVIGGAEFANDRLDINTLAGTDRVTSRLAPGVIQLFADGVPT